MPPRAAAPEPPTTPTRDSAEVERLRAELRKMKEDAARRSAASSKPESDPEQAHTETLRGLAEVCRCRPAPAAMASCLAPPDSGRVSRKCPGRSHVLAVRTF